MNYCKVTHLEDDVITPQVNYWSKWKRETPVVPIRAPTTNLLRKPDVVEPQVRYYDRFGITSGDKWKTQTRAESVSAAFDLPAPLRIDPGAIGLTDLTTEEKFRGSIPLTFVNFVRIIASSFKKNVDLLKEMNEGKKYSVIVDPKKSKVGPKKSKADEVEDLLDFDRVDDIKTDRIDESLLDFRDFDFGEDDLDPVETKSVVIDNVIDKLIDEVPDEKEVQASAEIISKAVKDSLPRPSLHLEDYGLDEVYQFDELRGSENNETLAQVLKYLAARSENFATPVEYVKIKKDGTRDNTGPRKLTTLLNDIRKREFGSYGLDLVSFIEFRPINWQRQVVQKK